MSRHFPFHHPVFGTKNKPKPIESWQNTVYYCWWEYLRRHDGYKKCCLRGGTGAFSRLYEDFGDVHATDFKTWWSEGSRCVRLFAEPKSDSRFGVLTEPPLPDDFNNENLLFLQVPLNFPKRFLKQRFNEALDEHHDGGRGKQYARKSKAAYPVTGQPNIDALRLILKVHDLKLAEPKLPLWQLAIRLNLFRLEQGQTKPAADRLNVITAVMSRYLKKAKTIIENVGKGKFPYDRVPRKAAIVDQPSSDGSSNN